MAEETLAQPLSGENILEAITYRVREALQRNCYLNPVAAYDAFSADIRISIRMRDVGRPANVDERIHVESEKLVPEERDFLAESDLHLGEAPPNQVRIETEQAIPVLTTDADGHREIKNVKHEKPKR